MSAKLLKTLVASHMNGIDRTLGALEVQVTSLKHVLKSIKGETDDAVEEDEDEPAPAKKGKKGKKVVDEDEEDETDEDEEESDDEGEEDEDEEESDESEDEEDESDDEDEEESSGKSKGAIKKQTVVKALQAYAKATSRKKALAMLKKMGTGNVHQLDPSKYKKLLALLEA